MAGSSSKTTRAAIHAAALPLFVADGFDATSMHDIAAAAGISRRTLYRYFRDKEEVFFEYHARETELLRELLESLPDRGLSAVLRDFVHALIADAKVLRFRVQVVASTPHLVGRALQRRSEWEQCVAEAIARAAGATVPTLEMKFAGAVAMTGLYIGVREIVYAGAEADATVDRVIELVEPVIRP